MKLTKIEKARVIAQALYNLDDLPHEDTAPTAIARQIKQEARHKKAFVEARYETALGILAKKAAAGHKMRERDRIATSRGPARITKVYPLGTIDVEVIATGDCFRITGLFGAKARALKA